MNQPHPFCFFVYFVCFVVKIRALIPNSGWWPEFLTRRREDAKEKNLGLLRAFA